MSERFKKSRYNHFVQSKEGKRLAFNAMSCGLAEMDDDSYRRFELLSDGGKDSINDDGELLKNLKLGGFLVSENVDELDILRAGHYKMRFGNKGFGLTIIPTFNCNFLNVALLLTIVTLVFDIPLGINIGGALLAIVLTITSLSASV